MHYTASEQSVSDINPGIAAAVAREFSDIVVGVKSAHYWAKPEDAAHPTWASIDGAREAAQLCRKLVMVDSIPIAGERPVSYTHLDVYKRQGKWMERDDSRTYAAMQRPVGARVGDGAA